jgi:hypothetical protein
MQFNPSSKVDSIIADIDFLLWGDGSTLNTNYSLIDRTRNVNISLDEIVAELHKADPNYQWDDSTNEDFPIATLAITAAQDHYSLLDSTLVIHRVRMKDSSGVMKTLTPRLESEFSDSELASTGTPIGYYKIGQAVFPVPVPDYGYSAGVELSFQRGANHFESTDTDTSPGFNSMFHQYLSVGAALRYALANGLDKKISYLDNKLKEIKKDIMEHYQRRSPDDRTRMRLKRAGGGYGL